MSSREVPVRINVRILLPIGLVMLAALGGCGGGADVKVQGTTTISKGQELSDLQRALTEGAITQREYDEVRKKIINRSD